jgi:hypothetical protein
MIHQLYHNFDGWSFVGCPTRLGTVTKQGPISGEVWGIPHTGTWILAEDAEVLCDIREDIWCFRMKDYINIQTVFYLSPDTNQVKELENVRKIKLAGSSG